MPDLPRVDAGPKLPQATQAQEIPDGRVVVPRRPDSSGGVSGVEVVYDPPDSVALEDFPGLLLKWVDYQVRNNRPELNARFSEQSRWFAQNFEELAAGLKEVGALAAARPLWNGTIDVYAEPARVDDVVRRLAARGNVDQEPPLDGDNQHWFARLEQNEVGLRVLPRAGTIDEAARQLMGELTRLGAALFGGGGEAYTAHLQRMQVEDGAIHLDLFAVEPNAQEFERRLLSHFQDAEGRASYQGYPIRVTMSERPVG